MASGDVDISTGINPLAKRGYYFDGIDDRLTLSIPSNFDGTGDFSINIWTKLYSTVPTSSSSYSLAMTGATGSSSRVIMGIVPSATACIWMKGQQIVSSAEVTDLKWHMLTLTYNKATAKAYGYVDGVLKNAGTSITDTSTSGPITIADASYSPGTGYTKCSIAKLTFYKRSLTQAEITALYNSNTIPEDVYCNFPLQEDTLDKTGRFTATVGSNPFVLSMDDIIATNLKTKRTTAGSTGKFFLCKLNKKIVTGAITG